MQDQKPSTKRLLAVDARWIHTGIGRYTLSVLQAARDYAPEVDVLAITRPQHVELLRPLCSKLAVTSTSVYTAREHWEMPRLARGAAAFIAPHFNAPLLWHGRLLVTIHDLTHFLHPAPQCSRLKRRTAMLVMRRAARKAHQIIAPSRYTRAMLVKHMGVKEGKVAVVPGFAAAPFSVMNKEYAREWVAGRYGLRDRYLLYVGNLAPHKNVALLAKALELCCARDASAPMLVIASNDAGGMAALEQHLQRLRERGKVRWLRGVNDTELADLYGAAAATVMPSREEGFGLPVLESMACGTPVICARTASLPEVGGEAALYFDPHSAQDLRRVIMTLIGNAELQRKMRAAGLARAQVFSPHAISARHGWLIRSLLEPLNPNSR